MNFDRLETYGEANQARNSDQIQELKIRRGDYEMDCRGRTCIPGGKGCSHKWGQRLILIRITELIQNYLNYSQNSPRNSHRNIVVSLVQARSL
jgi:hypothetical protein